MLTAIAGDDLATARRRVLAHASRAHRTSSPHDLLDQFADLTHSADAAARRMVRAG